MIYKFLCIDFQNEFADKNGKWYNGGKSIDFINNILTPFLREKDIKVSEIISDYRAPRRLDTGDACYPGTFGYESQLAGDIKSENVWIKCMNSPLWVRKNIGKPNTAAGLPYQDIKKFEKWLQKKFGSPSKDFIIIVFGLTLDCCVLSTCQELYWRGYQLRVLIEATDTMPHQKEFKKQIIDDGILNHWLKFITFNELKEKM